MAKNPKGFREFLRKALVSLKRKPSTIALVVMVIAFLYYSFNLTHFSDTTALINGANMGLAEFATMLFSTLSLVCFLNAFPYRKKTNIPMLILMLVMVGLVIYCDIYYGGAITRATTRAENRIDPQTYAFVGDASRVLTVHMVILCVGVALVALLPVYRPLLRKINTNIDVAGNEAMGQIDISGEDA